VFVLKQIQAAWYFTKKVLYSFHLHFLVCCSDSLHGNNWYTHSTRPTSMWVVSEQKGWSFLARQVAQNLSCNN